MCFGDIGVFEMNRGRYGVVVCTRCGNAKGVDMGSTTTQCPHCRKRLVVKILKVFYRSDSQTEIAGVVGELNAKLRDVEIPIKESKEPETYTLALRESSIGSNERERYVMIGRVLARELGTFDKNDLEKVISIRGVGDIDEILDVLRKSDLFYEPQAGTFKAVEP